MKIIDPNWKQSPNHSRVVYITDMRSNIIAAIADTTSKPSRRFYIETVVGGGWKFLSVHPSIEEAKAATIAYLVSIGYIYPNPKQMLLL